MTKDQSVSGDRAGLPYALGAYVIWGIVPAYFKLLSSVPAIEIVAQRIVWTLPILLVIMMFRRQYGEFLAALRNRKMVATLFASACFIATNWLIYIWAVANDHILATALGYYLTPLINVALARIVLGERLRPLQWFAVAIALGGTAVLAAGALDTLWISLTLAFSFSTYGLIRKVTVIGSVPGLGVETVLLLPFAAGAALWFLVEPAPPGFGESLDITLLLIFAGAVTAAPLLLFATAARRMRYSTLGFVQYIGPTIAFFLGVFAYGEELGATRLTSFALIWLGIAIFSFDVWRTGRRKPVAPLT